MSQHPASRLLLVCAIVSMVWAAACSAPLVTPSPAVGASVPTEELVDMGPALPSPAVGALAATPLLIEEAAQAPTATAPAEPTATPAALELSLLHTSDTWGYVLPCG